MTVYVDRLAEWGWKPHGVAIASCHLFTDTLDLTELHDIAARIGMQRAWFQDKQSAPHYDLNAARRGAAVALGVVELDWDDSVRIWKARRAAVAQAVAQALAQALAEADATAPAAGTPPPDAR